jgi:hypothetical protein
LWNVAGNVLFLLTNRIFFGRDRLRRALMQWLPRTVIRSYVKLLFLMIGHGDRDRSFLRSCLSGRTKALNCDA